ncbi:hypothetical protein J2X31_000603 [Flavobacterium arsenatis]|uniref:Outer membrane protein beta-barrel domain-containing protein n=1 Tax=Flavobacterium arsenatis TaxID=1484332 RepID=A0ABU1TKZ6_9FLAO|nr:hypothetical protein [Flavobacterium arsenatis]MDR6966605.1 hypothetical protein [Flavobacterium arsenatis]
MKAFYPTLFFVLCSLTSSNAQNDTTSVEKPQEMTVDLMAIYTPVLNKDFYGFNFDFKVYVKEKWATGASFSYAGKEVDNNFGYEVERPSLNFLAIGWINQYDVIKKEKFRLGLNVNNGVIVSRLMDKDVIEEVWTEFGPQENFKRVRTNTFYLFEPGIDASVRLFGNNFFPDFYLTAKAKYRVAVGNARFGETSDFTNYYVGVGVSLIGFMEKPDKN